MVLFDILKNRGSVNILKQLYDQEVVLKHGYTLKLSKIAVSLRTCPDLFSSSKLLSEHGLISLENIENDHVLSITEKGKHFIEVFDQLIDLMSTDHSKKQKTVNVKYDLTEIEKKILILVYKISKELGKDIPLKILTEELYPYQDYSKKISTVSRYVNRLVSLNLIQKTKDSRKSFLKLTNSGFKVMNEQYLRALI